VVGAGISLPHKIPSWSTLVQRLWDRVFTTPLNLQAHPLGNQFALELIEHAVAKDHDSLEDAFNERNAERFAQELEHNTETQLEAGSGDESAAVMKEKVMQEPASLFTRLLREALYEDFRTQYPDGKFWDEGGKSSLETLGEVLRRDHAGPRAITRVITFNADDLLERVVFKGRMMDYQSDVVWPIARETHHTRLTQPRPIPLYHIHGFLPEHQSYLRRHGEDTLVFTDMQYWSSVANPNSFANRVFLTALHDSHCIFVGLSMADINLIRWLGIRATEVFKDRLQANAPGSLYDVKIRAEKSLSRHFWITLGDQTGPTPRRNPSKPQNLLHEFLLRRGVQPVTIGNWEDDFESLMTKCFPPSASPATPRSRQERF